MRVSNTKVPSSPLLTINEENTFVQYIAFIVSTETSSDTTPLISLGPGRFTGRSRTDWIIRVPQENTCGKTFSIRSCNINTCHALCTQNFLLKGIETQFLKNVTFHSQRYPLNFYLSHNEGDKVNYPKFKMLDFDNIFKCGFSLNPQSHF